MRKQIPADEISIYSAVGFAQSRWAQLEYEVCRVFSEAVSPLSHLPGLRSAISPPEDAFWSVVSFDAKLKMTNAAVERRINGHWPGDATELLDEWKKIQKRVSEKASKRNQLAHGRIHREAQAKGAVQVSFVPFFYQRMTGHQAIFGPPGREVFIASFPMPIERWGVARIMNIAQGFDIAIIRIARFLQSFQNHNELAAGQERKLKNAFEINQANKHRRAQ